MLRVPAIPSHQSSERSILSHIDCISQSEFVRLEVVKNCLCPRDLGVALAVSFSPLVGVQLRFSWHQHSHPCMRCAQTKADM